MTLALLALLWLPVASADEPSPAGAPEDAGPPISQELATYRQLAWELHQLAKRDHWAGVERTYEQMVALGLAIGREDHLLGATSASTIGDVSATLHRLREAHKLGESRDVIEWMYRLDTKYGRVVIHDERRRPGKLESSSAHFMPDANAAVEFAQSKVSTGSFEGLLPVGAYRYGRDDFDVIAGETVELIYAKR